METITDPAILNRKMETPKEGDFPALALLPTDRMIHTVIKTCDLRYQQFNKMPVYVQDKDKNNILDKEGNPIRKIELFFVFEIQEEEFDLNGNTPRNLWLNNTWSFHEKAKLPATLDKLGIDYSEGLTAQEVKDKALYMEVDVMVEDYKKQNGDKGQRILTFKPRKKAVKSDVKATVTENIEDINWEE